MNSSLPPSLPRSLPPQVAAASLAATLRGARRRRVRRRAGQSAALLTVICAAALGLQSIGSAPTGGVNPASLNPSGKSPASDAQSGRNHGTVDIPLSIPRGSWQVEQSTPSVQVSGTGSSAAPPIPAPTSPTTPPVMLVKEESSFILVRSQPVETIRTPLAATESEPENPPVPPDAASHITVSTVSMPPPLIITTAQTVSPQAIATADTPESPDFASDADLFALSEGRPTALCRLSSGGAHWFWLDQPALR